MPGPRLAISSLNVSSLLKHVGPISEREEIDVQALQEVRLTEDAINIANETLYEEEGRWIPTWGQPQPIRRGTRYSVLDARPGGVGTITLNKHLAVPTPRTQVGEELYRTGRWISTTIRLNKGAAVFHVVNYYGVSGANEGGNKMEENEALLSKVFDEAKTLGDTPIVIMGDFNVETAKSHILTSMHATGQWHDVAQLLADIGEGQAPEHTYEDNGATSRIDMAWVNPAAARLLTGFKVESLEDEGIKKHKAVTVEFNSNAVVETVLKTQRVKKLPEMTPLSEEDENQLEEDIRKTHERPFYEAWENGNIDEMYDRWCELAEEYLLQKAAITGTAENILTDPKYRGRGRAATAKEEKVGIAAATLEGFCPDPHLDQLERLFRKVRDVGAQLLVGNLEQARHAWAKAGEIYTNSLRRALKLQGNPWNGRECPSPGEIEILKQRIAEAICTANANARQRLVAKYRKRRTERAQGASGAVFKEFKDPESAPLAVLKRPDGTVTGSIKEMDGLIRADWLKIFAKHDPAYGNKPVPSVENFIREYAHLIKGEKQEVDNLTVSDLTKAIGKLSNDGAGGLDGWLPKEVKMLPEWVLELLLLVYDKIEATGVWPSQLCWAGVTLIPKGEGGRPLDLRPITVTSIIYRIWAAARMRHSLDWQETWLHKGQHGARAKHSTVDALIQISVTLEKALLDGLPLAGVAIDLSKAFDNIPVDITFAVLERMGIDPKISAPLRGMYKQIRRRFKLGGCVGQEFVSTNGILQGCPLSVMLLNALMAVLHNDFGDNLGAQSFVDDLTIMGRKKALEKAMEKLQKFVDLTGQEVNAKKTKAFGIGQAQNIIFKGKSLEWATEVKLLGVKLKFTAERLNLFVDQEKVEKTVRLANRVRYSGLPFHLRMRVLEGLVGPRIGYGYELLDLDTLQERKIRTAITGAIWQKKSKLRSAGLLFVTVTKGHSLDPAQAPHYRRFAALRRALTNDPSLVPRVETLLERLGSRRKVRGNGFVASLLYSCRRVGIRKLGDGLVFQVLEDGNVIDTEAEDMSKYLHGCRELCRRAVLRAVEKERQRSGIVTGIAAGLNKEVSLAQYWKMDARRQGIFRKIICSAVWTQSLRAKMPRNGGQEWCEHCAPAPKEDHDHLFWDCTTWAEYRADYINAYGHPANLPPCLRLCGLVPVGLDVSKEQVGALQNTLVKVFEARFGTNGEPEGV